MPFVSWGVFGGTTPAQSAHFFASWGLMAVLYSGVATAMAVFAHYYRMLRG